MENQKIKIALKKLNGLVLEKSESGADDSCADCSYEIALTLNAELMRLGFTLTRELLNTIAQLQENTAATLAKAVLKEVKLLLGANVPHRPMYPNFPKQVIEASVVELYFNALCHYWTLGEWLPEYEKMPRKFAFESTKFREINLVSEAEFTQIFTGLLNSADSLSDEDKQIIAWFVNEYPLHKLNVPVDIPFAENRCVFASELLQQGMPFAHLILTTTDVLRVATCLSGGDVSLAENTKFKSLPRKMRKQLIAVLEKVLNEEDVVRHQKKWVRLFHNLHVGEFSSDVNKVAFKARNNLKMTTFYGKLEASIAAGKLSAAVSMLSQRPGEFGRRLDQLIRMTGDEYEQLLVVEKFLSIADQIPTRNLLQLLGHINRRTRDLTQRVVFPKGKVQNAVIVRAFLASLLPSVASDIQEGINAILEQRFAEKESLGKVWIDSELIDCPLPTQQRSASAGLFSVARGTRLPIGNKGTLRFFVYWVGQDIDLSATFHDENFNMIEQVSYTNLRSAGYKAYHSGDITRAPDGASEFIDVDIASARDYGARYVAMNVIVYSGPAFEQHEECFAGWMTRSAPNSNEIYEPETVAQKIDIRTASRNVMPVVFDLHTGKAIWVDIAMKGSYWYGGNNIHSNRASIQEKLQAIVSSDHKLSLYELFSLHAAARGTMAASPEEADTLFGLDEGVTPYDINQINAEYVG